MISLGKYGYANQNQKESSFQRSLQGCRPWVCREFGLIGLTVFK